VGCFWVFIVSGAFTESVVEDAALVWLEGAGWRPHGFRSADLYDFNQPIHNLAISRD
jgi:hypothetical protein